MSKKKKMILHLNYFNSLLHFISIFTLNIKFTTLLTIKGHTKVKVKVAQSSLTLCNLMDYTVHGILQARILEWVAFPFSRGSSQPRD